MAKVYDSNYVKLMNELSVKNEADLPLIANAISNLWDNDIIKKIYIYRYMDKFRTFNDKLMENTPLIFDKIDEVFVEKEIDYESISMGNKLILKFDNFFLCKIDSGIQFTDYLSDKSYVKFRLIDVPYNDGIIKYLDDYDGDLFDNIQGIIYTLPLSDFCGFDDGTNKNIANDSFEYLNKLVSIPRFKSSFVFMVGTKRDIFNQNIVNGYPLSGYVKPELDINDQVGVITILLFLIPGFIRFCCCNDPLPQEIVNLVDRYLGFLNMESNANSLKLQKAESFVKDMLHNLKRIHFKQTNFYITEFMNLSDLSEYCRTAMNEIHSKYIC